MSFQLYQFWLLKETQFIELDEQLDEISGIEFDKRGNLWAINDGGDKPRLYQIDSDGKVSRTIDIENAKNWDWEDMTQNDFGHFFIGDFGNNSKDREWMTIYKIENPIDIKSASTRAEVIKFTYPDFDDQDSSDHFADAHYDIEAFVYFKRRLYLFTKNRSLPFDGKTRLYRIGDHAANFKAEFIGEFSSCSTLRELCWITSAALSPDRSKLVLLGSDRLWLFEDWEGDNFFSGQIYQIDLGLVTQKEAVTFKNDTTVIFTDEIFNGIGGNGYEINLNSATRKRFTVN
nr:hypothetical protein [Alteromonas oceanisediminis]